MRKELSIIDRIRTKPATEEIRRKVTPAQKRARTAVAAAGDAVAVATTAMPGDTATRLPELVFTDAPRLTPMGESATIKPATGKKATDDPSYACSPHPHEVDGMTIPGQILLVDDDAVFRSEFKESFDEFDIIEVASGEAALALLRGPHEIELILLDVRMSGLSGIETLHQIRKIAPTVRIIVFTGYSSTSVAVEALRGQADDFLEKPLDFADTRKLFKKYLGNRRGQPAINSLGAKDKIERVKDFLQRNARKKVTLADAAKIIHLSPKHLSRLFRQQTGGGFSDYKLTVKIAEAKRMLLESGCTVVQIATTLGYENPESLIRQFKCMVQFTPTEFRRKHQPAGK